MNYKNEDSQIITKGFVDAPCDRCGNLGWRRKDGTIPEVEDLFWEAPVWCPQCGRKGVLKQEWLKTIQ